jgi:hypothetical protein
MLRQDQLSVSLDTDECVSIANVRISDTFGQPPHFLHADKSLHLVSFNVGHRNAFDALIHYSLASRAHRP